MITLETLFILFLLLIVICFIWNHANMSRVARAAAKRYCEKEGVQFLDQNVILRKLSIRFAPHSLFAFGRQYSFEFSSMGDQRYQGCIFLVGNRVEQIELPPYKTM